MAEKSLFCGINKPADPANLTDPEKKHIPIIECPDSVKAGEPFRVKINIGEIPHVMEQTHHIQWIELYSGDNYYARFDLTPVFTKPEVSITLVKGGKHGKARLRAIERCNVHGQWEAVKEITVTD